MPLASAMLFDTNIAYYLCFGIQYKGIYMFKPKFIRLV